MTENKYYNIAKKKLFHLNRSITGKGTLETLKIIKSEFPKFKIKKTKSGSKAFDWVVPNEWNIKQAYIKDKYKKKIINFKNNNLHIIGYSKPVKIEINKKKLLKNLFSLKNQPNAIPYITSYYKKTWGFCLSEIELNKIKKNYSDYDKFNVVIDSKFNPKGNLHYGELIIKGSSKKEILISTYICHPSMANNELSGLIVSMKLINYFLKKKLKNTIKFIFIPETIGSIVYLSKNLNNLKKNVFAGYNLTCIGDERNHSCMLTKYKNTPSDEALIEAYKKLRIKNFKIHSFLERGSDERQFNSPGIDLPIASIFRTKYGCYKEYHTSLDNFDIVTPKGINGGFKVVKNAINYLNENDFPKVKILCEPQMGKRKLYPLLSRSNSSNSARKFMDFMQYSDGKNSLKNISKKIRLSIKETRKVYKLLKEKKLVD